MSEMKGGGSVSGMSMGETKSPSENEMHGMNMSATSGMEMANMPGMKMRNASQQRANMRSARK
jgi:hypothetical protein